MGLPRYIEDCIVVDVQLRGGHGIHLVPLGGGQYDGEGVRMSGSWRRRPPRVMPPDVCPRIADVQPGRSLWSRSSGFAECDDEFAVARRVGRPRRRLGRGGVERCSDRERRMNRSYWWTLAKVLPTTNMFPPSGREGEVSGKEPPGIGRRTSRRLSYEAVVISQGVASVVLVARLSLCGPPPRTCFLPSGEKATPVGDGHPGIETLRESPSVYEAVVISQGVASVVLVARWSLDRIPPRTCSGSVRQRRRGRWEAVILGSRRRASRRLSYEAVVISQGVGQSILV